MILFLKGDKKNIEMVLIIYYSLICIFGSKISYSGLICF